MSWYCCESRQLSWRLPGVNGVGIPMRFKKKRPRLVPEVINWEFFKVYNLEFLYTYVFKDIAQIRIIHILRKPRRDMGISKMKAKANRYIELCNPFSRIGNLCSQISIVLKNSTIRSLGLRVRERICNPRERIIEVEGTNYLSVRTGSQSEKTDCTIRYNDLF